METERRFYEPNERVKRLVGPVEPGTRIYSTQAPIWRFRLWVEVLLEELPVIPQQFVADFVGVSRAAVHKRIKEGRLTVFRFTLVDQIEGFFGKPRSRHRENYTFVPLEECVAWWSELEEKQNEEARRKSPPELW